MFPSDVRVEVAPLSDGNDHELFPEEQQSLAGCVPKRVREFATGRVLGRRALRDLGYPPVPIPAGEDRAPQWPAGAVGSISHSDSLCIVVAGRSSSYRSLAVDVEARRPLDRALWPRICTPDELRRLHAEPDASAALATLFFTAKECAYKCQYPLSGKLLEFHDVEVHLWDDLSGFSASFSDPFLLGPGLHELAGQLRWSAEHVLAGAWLPAEPARAHETSRCR